jgi:hypothetical protein
MVAVRMMQMSVDEIVGVIPVRHRFVTAARTMPMRRIMSAATVVGRAAIGVGCAHLDDVLVDVIFMRVMQMTVVKIVDVAVVPNRDMTAARFMRVRVVGVNRMIVRSHGLVLSGLVVIAAQCAA